VTGGARAFSLPEALRAPARKRRWPPPQRVSRFPGVSFVPDASELPMIRAFPARRIELRGQGIPLAQ